MFKTTKKPLVGKVFKKAQKKERQNRITPKIRNSMFYDPDGFWKIFNGAIKPQGK